MVNLRWDWLAHSWLTGTARAMVLPPSLSLDWGVREVELAEANGSAATLWLPLRAPRQQDEWDESDQTGPSDYMAYGDEKWLQRFDHIGAVVMQVTGMQGVAKFVVATNGILLTCDSGLPVVFDDAGAAIAALLDDVTRKQAMSLSFGMPPAARTPAEGVVVGASMLL